MRFELSEEQRFLVDTTQSFLAKELPPTALRAWMRNAAGQDYRQWWRTCAGLGWSGIFAPESCDDYGSVSGAPVVDAAIVSEIAGRALAPSALPGCSVAVRALGDAAPDADPTFRGVLDGSRIAAFALEEPAGTWNLDAVATSARREGDDLVVTGSKVNVPDAATADVLVVACQVDDGVGLVLVPIDAAGVDVTQKRGWTCYASSAMCAWTMCGWALMRCYPPVRRRQRSPRTRAALRPACSSPKPSGRSTTSADCCSIMRTPARIRTPYRWFPGAQAPDRRCHALG